MGRASQFFWAVNAKEYPSRLEQQVRYTSLELDPDFDPEPGKIIKKLRRKIRADKKKLTDLTE